MCNACDLGTVVDMAGRHHQHVHTDRAGALDHGIAVRIEFVRVEMTVRVYPHAGLVYRRQLASRAAH